MPDERNVDYNRLSDRIESSEFYKKTFGEFGIGQTNVIEKLLVHLANPALVKTLQKEIDDPNALNTLPRISDRKRDDGIGIIFRSKELADAVVAGLSKQSIRANYIGTGPEMFVLDNLDEGHGIGVKTPDVLAALEDGRLGKAFNELEQSGAFNDDLKRLCDGVNGIYAVCDVPEPPTSSQQPPAAEGHKPTIPGRGGR